MYDVKQMDPAEWSSPPWDAALVDKPGLGKVIMSRGAVNQKGPQSAFLAALHAFRTAGVKPPVNFAFVAEGEEEIGSPNFPQVVHNPEVAAVMRKCSGVSRARASRLTARSPFHSAQKVSSNSNYQESPGRPRWNVRKEARRCRPLLARGLSESAVAVA